MSVAPKTIVVDFNGNGTASVISDVPVILGTAGYTLTSSVAAQIEAAVLAEREACAEICDGMILYAADDIAAAIRTPIPD